VVGLQSNFTLEDSRESVVIERIPPNGTNFGSTETNITKISRTLYLNQAHGADNGYVVCVAENIVGKDENSSLLRISCKSYSSYVSIFVMY